MKNQKLKLQDLKVQSFVTSMDGKEKHTIDGGSLLTCFIWPAKIGSGGACSEGCPLEPAVPNPWCTVGGAEACWHAV